MPRTSNEQKSAQVTVRDARETDLARINEIYNYYALTSTATFETEGQSVEARSQWWDEHRQSGLPIMVVERDGEVVGWGSLSRYHSRCAYKMTAEPSLYIAKECLGQNLGRQLLDELVVRARACGLHCLVLLICSENTASLKLAQDFGFELVGTLKEVGRKFDRWLDVTMAQKIL